MPALAKLSSRCLGTGCVKVRLKRISSRQSIESCSDRIPLPFIRRAQSITSAAPTSTFFGSQPRSAQVPPNGLESTIATCHPAARHRDATADAPAPVPIATTSNCLPMFCLLEVRSDWTKSNYLFEDLDILIRRLMQKSCANRGQKFCRPVKAHNQLYESKLHTSARYRQRVVTASRSA